MPINVKTTDKDSRVIAERKLMLFKITQRDSLLSPINMLHCDIHFLNNKTWKLVQQFRERRF